MSGGRDPGIDFKLCSVWNRLGFYPLELLSRSLGDLDVSIHEGPAAPHGVRVGLQEAEIAKIRPGPPRSPLMLSSEYHLWTWRANA